MSGSDVDDAVNDLLRNLREKQSDYLTRMDGSEYHFERFELLKYKLHKISLRRGRSYIESPKWINNKKRTINPKNEDDKCIIYAIIASLHDHDIDSHSERISELKPYINEYNWHGLEFRAKLIDSKKSEENNSPIALNILFVPNCTKDIRLAYKSKYNCEPEKKSNFSNDW